MAHVEGSGTAVTTTWKVSMLPRIAVTKETELKTGTEKEKSKPLTWENVSGSTGPSHDRSLEAVQKDGIATRLTLAGHFLIS
jgi:hypothetical protein